MEDNNFTPKALFHPPNFGEGIDYRIHNLMSEIKRMSVEMASQQVQVAFLKLEKEPSRENAEWLEKTMQIQNIAENYKEWPNSFQAISTIIITLLIPITQISIELFKVWMEKSPTAGFYRYLTW